MGIRLAAAQLSGSVKCIEAEDILKSLSETDSNAKVREAAEEALKNMQKS